MKSGSSALSGKAEDFAALVVVMCRALRREKQERHLSDCLFRSGTAIGMHINASGGCADEAEFAACMGRALSCCRETMYWLRLLLRTGYISEEQYLATHDACDRLRKMIGSITKLMQIDAGLRPSKG